MHSNLAAVQIDKQVVRCARDQSHPQGGFLILVSRVFPAAAPSSPMSVTDDDRNSFDNSWNLCRVTTMPMRLTHASLKVLAVMLRDKSRDFYGLELMNTAGLSSGTLYPILFRFEGAGLVESHWEKGEPQTLGRPLRRIYKLSGKGVRVARESLSELNARVSRPVVAATAWSSRYRASD